MARQLERLSAKAVAAKRAPGHYADGSGLYLQVSKFGTKSWIFRYTDPSGSRTPKGYRRIYEMGLGALHTFSLADARQRATAARKLLADGVDPIKARKATKAAQALAQAKLITFREAAEQYIKGHRSQWHNTKHAGQWATTLDTYAYPVLGRVSVGDVDTGLVLKVLEPIWTEKTETATRLRQRIEKVLDWANVRGHRSGPNPARWKGHLSETLPKPSKIKQVTNHAAIDYRQLGAFMAALRDQEGFAARALEFTVLTAARTGEVIGATWSEINFDNSEWTIPAARMKAGRPHRVALSPAALVVLTRMQGLRTGDYVFPGLGKNRPLSNMAMLALLKRMGRADLTTHGFRATFKTWASETTHFPREVIELALAHRLGDAAEQAYARGDLLEKRRRLMNAWAEHCNTVEQSAKVIPLTA